MFDLTRQEKAILIFLVSTFVLGALLSGYKKAKTKPKLDIKQYALSQLNPADIPSQGRLVNINSLKPEELKRLPGVGEKLAQNIIVFHETHGPFSAKEELLQVEGIGPKKFEQLKDLIITE